MKDYSKVKYVKAPVDGEDITKGKVYDFRFSELDNGCLKDDSGYSIRIRLTGCFHVYLSDWIPCDKDGNEINF